MTFFPYETVSEFFGAEGDFQENRDFEEERANQRLLEEEREEAMSQDAFDMEMLYAQQEIDMLAEDEQDHWEQDPEYVARYFPPEEG